MQDIPGKPVHDLSELKIVKDITSKGFVRSISMLIHQT